MSSIILIATGHRENGLCNSTELLKIIEQIAPDMIFEETSPNMFPGIYEGKFADSVESSAIKKYLQKNSVAQLPVDKNVDQATAEYFQHVVSGIFDVFDYNSPEYLTLSHEFNDCVEQLGFPYLNSDKASAILERKHFLERQIVKFFNDPSLIQHYGNWLKVMDVRESEMLKNIYEYSIGNKYETGLFLVGAEHRKPIMDKIPEFEKATEQKINWVFNYLW